MIEYRGFTKRFGAILAADDVSLSIGEGETLGLIGPNGSGKTTTLKALVGLVRPTGGAVLVHGRDVHTGDPAARAGIGYLPQRVTFPEGMRAVDVIRLYARLRQVDLANPFQLLDEVGLTEAANRAVDDFSGGMRQRLGLAVSLLGDPHTVVLDEPSAALDPSGALRMRDLIGRIRQRGCTVLLCSHDLGEVAQLSDRIALFVRGQVRAIGTLSHLAGEARTVVDIEQVYRAHVTPRLLSIA
jgi:ABC-type multidrug transport system ATPase subunit